MPGDMCSDPSQRAFTILTSDPPSGLRKRTSIPPHFLTHSHQQPPTLPSPTHGRTSVHVRGRFGETKSIQRESVPGDMGSDPSDPSSSPRKRTSIPPHFLKHKHHHPPTPPPPTHAQSQSPEPRIAPPAITRPPPTRAHPAADEFSRPPNPQREHDLVRPSPTPPPDTKSRPEEIPDEKSNTHAPECSRRQNVSVAFP